MMEGDGDGTGTQEETGVVTERGEEKVDIREDDIETQIEQDCETQVETKTPPGVNTEESTQSPSLILKTSRKRTRKGRYLSLDLDLLNSSKVREITNTNTDTSGEVGSEEKVGRDQKKRRTSFKRNSRRTTSTRSLNSRSSSGEELDEIDLRNKLNQKRAEGNSESSSRRSSQAESYKSFISSEDLLSEAEGSLRALDSNWNEQPAAGILRLINSATDVATRQSFSASTPLSLKGHATKAGIEQVQKNDEEDIIADREENMSHTRMDETSDKEDESEIINTLKKKLEVAEKKNVQLEKEKVENEKEKEEMKRRLGERKSKIPKPISRSYITPREDIPNRLTIETFEKLMDQKYSMSQYKITKCGEITVNQNTGEVGGYTGFMKEMMEDSNFRGRSVADVMSSQVITYHKVSMDIAVEQAMAEILAKPGKEGKKKTMEDNVTVADMAQFVRKMIDSSVDADVHAVKHNQIATVEEIATDLHRNQQDTVDINERIGETSRKVQEIEKNTFNREEVTKMVQDEGKKDYYVIIKDYPKMNEIRNKSQKERKEQVCKDLKDLDDKIEVDQISGVWPPSLHQNNTRMKTSGKGTLRILLKRKKGHLYYEDFCQRYPSGASNYGRLIPYKTRSEVEDERNYYRMVDKVAKETEPHIITEYRDLDNCERALDRDFKGVADKLVKYNIRIVNRWGRNGSSNGPNIQLLKKPDISLTNRSYENLNNLFYQQMSQTLRRSINSLRRSQPTARPMTSGPSDVDI